MATTIDYTNNPMLAPLPVQVPARAAPATAPQQAPAANPFDQFDGHPAAGNVFDQFDPPRQAKPDGVGSSFARNLLNDATFGLSEPAVAAVQATFGDPTNPTSQAGNWSDRYHQNLAALRGGLQADRAANPIASFTGGFAGGIANPAVRLLGPVDSLGDAVMAGAKFGMGYGAGNAVADDQGLDSIATGALKGAAIGGATGGLLQKAGGAIADALQPRIAPTIQALKDAAQAAYTRLDNSGVQIGTDALNAMGDGAAAKFGGALGDPDISAALYPKASAALRLVSSYGADGTRGGASATLGDLDQLRRVVADAASTPDKPDRFMARQILDHVDDFVGGLTPGDMDAGATGAAQAVQDLTQARDYWKRYSQATQLQGILDKAANNGTGFSQSGYENAIRSGFRKLLNNDRAIGRFSPDVRAAIQQVATGGSSLSATNLLRQVGKLSPQGAVPLLSEAGMVMAAGPHALALPAVGLASRIAATALQKGAAQRAIELAATGGAGATVLPKTVVPASLARSLMIQQAKRLPRLTAAAVPLAVSR
jgi:hypothetical protein